MKKLALVLFSFMLTGSSYAMNQAFCVVTGATRLDSTSNVVKLSIPQNTLDLGILFGEVSAQEVYIVTREGSEDYVMEHITIKTDYLEINGCQRVAHGPYEPPMQPLSCVYDCDITK